MMRVNQNLQQMSLQITKIHHLIKTQHIVRIVMIVAINLSNYLIAYLGIVKSIELNIWQLIKLKKSILLWKIV